MCACLGMPTHGTWELARRKRALEPRMCSGQARSDYCVVTRRRLGRYSPSEIFRRCSPSPRSRPHHPRRPATAAQSTAECTISRETAGGTVAACRTALWHQGCIGVYARWRVRPVARVGDGHYTVAGAARRSGKWVEPADVAAEVLRVCRRACARACVRACVRACATTMLSGSHVARLLLKYCTRRFWHRERSSNIAMFCSCITHVA